MAKSIRSKSQRKSRAILRAQVFKPVEDARAARISKKLSGDAAVAVSSEAADSMMTDATALESKPEAPKVVYKKSHLHRGSMKEMQKLFKSELNTHGLSWKEVRF